MNSVNVRQCVEYTLLGTLAMLRRLPLPVLISLILAACSAADQGGGDGDTPDVAISGLQISPDKCPNDRPDFVEPTDEQKTAAVTAHSGVDPNGVVPANLLADALGFLDVNKDKFDNQRFMAVVDFSKPNSKKRFFLVNLETGAVEAHQVAHGSGSDPGHTGTPTRFSNVQNSFMSSLGYFRTMDLYDGKHPHSLQISGLSATNDQVCRRSVIVHPAAYVHDNGQPAGMSEGCFALDPSVEVAVTNKLKLGALIFSGRSAVN